MLPQLRHRLPYGPEAPAAARDALDVLDGRVRSERLEDLRLLVSELVTNSVRHGCPQDGTVELRVGLEDDRACVEVVDGGGHFAPFWRAPDGGSPGGWGLMLVDRLARRWGVETDGETRVWLELDVAGARPGRNV